MGLSCADGRIVGPGRPKCRADDTRNFSGAVTPMLLAFEDLVLRDYFKATREAWEGDETYHAYHVSTILRTGRVTTMDRVWHEFARRPAPRLTGARDQPVRTGEQTFVVAHPRGYPPLVGGYVVHFVNQPLYALINATTAAHVLYPGLIMRWIVQTNFGIESHTVGRGVGWFPETNEEAGIQIFRELDAEVIKGLATRS